MKCREWNKNHKHSFKVYLLNHTYVVYSDISYNREQVQFLLRSQVNWEHRQTHQLLGCSVLVPTQSGQLNLLRNVPSAFPPQSGSS